MAGFKIEDIYAANSVRSTEYGVALAEHGCRMFGEIIWMTPDLAKEWLKLNVNNRKLRDSQLRKLRESISKDGYKLTHQGLAFCEDGSFIDGQHRLHTLIHLNMSCWVWVVFNVPDGSKINVDHKGLPRSITDNFQYSGRRIPRRISQAAIAAIEGVRFGVSKQGHSIGSLLKFIDEYYEPLEFTVDNVKSRSVDLQWIRGALCRAYIHGCDRSRLLLFCELLNHGDSKGYNPETDSSALRLKNWIVENKKLRASSTGRREAYAKTQNALRSFLNFEKPQKLYACYDELFPCPWDEKQ